VQKVSKGSLEIAKGEKVGTLYLCIGNIGFSISLDSTGVDTILRHHRLGHMSEKGIEILHKINLLPDLKQIDLISVSIVSMENIRESYFLESEKKRRVKG
jgi:hypothetical protein